LCSTDPIYARSNNGLYLRDQANYPGQVVRLNPDGRREIVRLDTTNPDAMVFIVAAEVEPLPPAQHWWRKQAF